jgi:hypothetical protein
MSATRNRILVNPPLSRRALLRSAAAAATALVLPAPLSACSRKLPAAPTEPSQARLAAWTEALANESLTRSDLPLGRSAIRIGELAIGTPYKAFTLESYLESGSSPAQEPLTLSLMHFDCVTLVEACLAIARLADDQAAPTWERFGQEVERMRYRGAERRGYSSRLHYFSEWISDGAKRGLLRDLGPQLGGAEDTRPLRFMTTHRDKYPALADDAVFRELQTIERRLDAQPRRVVPTKRIPLVVDRIESGDVLAFATDIPGLDVSHTAFAHRGADGVLRVLHAPLSGGVVEVTRSTLPEYVAAIRRSTGILVARPLRA